VFLAEAKLENVNWSCPLGQNRFIAIESFRSGEQTRKDGFEFVEHQFVVEVERKIGQSMSGADGRFES
jgi:hypothetical protein